jgi:hypothetical protein
MLVQLLPDWGVDGLINTLRSTGVTGSNESDQPGFVGGVRPVEPVGHGGGARLPRVVEPAAGADG